MKKTIITALVVLLVMLAFATCDSFITEPGAGAEKAEYTADGRILLDCEVNVGGTSGSRALTADLAKEEANFMEVIFKDDYNNKIKYYRAGGPLKKTLKIKLPEGTYNATNSILLIGKKTDGSGGGDDDYALLAIGTADNVTLNANNKTIDFSVSILETDLYAGATSSSFSITNTSFDNPFIAGSSGNTASGTWSDGESMCFQVPTNTEIFAKLDIAGFGLADLNTNIAFADPDSIADSSVTFDPDTSSLNSYGCSFNITSGTGTLSIKFYSGAIADEGYHTIFIDIPVVGFEVYDDPNISGSDTTTPGLDDAVPAWHIRGGTSSSPSKPQLVEEDEPEGIALYVGSRLSSMWFGKIKPTLPQQ